jgi:hypothetical protein
MLTKNETKKSTNGSKHQMMEAKSQLQILSSKPWDCSLPELIYRCIGKEVSNPRNQSI